jgi:hypothetical protein
MRGNRNLAVSINQQGQPERTTVEKTESHVKQERKPATTPGVRTGRLILEPSANHLVTAA